MIVLSEWIFNVRNFFFKIQNFYYVKRRFFIESFDNIFNKFNIKLFYLDKIDIFDVEILKNVFEEKEFQNVLNFNFILNILN